jgi:UV DNA damage endonuclease
MKIGYPCINTMLGCCANRTFRLSSYSPARFVDTVHSNLDALRQILEYNVAQKLLFFRISSCIIPFASHDVVTVDWRAFFAPKLKSLGDYIRAHNIRISMHPDQFVVLNSPHEHIVENSVRELVYHASFLDSLGLDTTHKMQIHGGGAYGDKPQALQRFITTYKRLSTEVTQRLVIENDERIYSVQDCLFLYRELGIPLLFDVLHHECLNNGESVAEALAQALQTWNEKDGIGMIDYSSQAPQAKRGKHIQSLDENHFRMFLETTRHLDFDIMLEVKDKQESALKALKIAQDLKRII